METHKRSIVKSISFRIIATITTLVVVWFFTKDLAVSGGVAIVENLVKMLFYYFHERAWTKISWGIKKDIILRSSDGVIKILLSLFLRKSMTSSIISNCLSVRLA